MTLASGLFGETVSYRCGALAAIGYPPPPRITIEAIQRRVASQFGIDPLEMVSDRRSWRVAHPRQVAMFLAKRLTRHSLPMIGARFGGRDHTTVIHAVKQVEKRMAENGQLNLTVQAIEEALTIIHQEEAN